MTTFITVIGIYAALRCLWRVIDATDPQAPLSMKGPMAWIGVAFDFAISAWAMMLIQGVA